VATKRIAASRPAKYSRNVIVATLASLLTDVSSEMVVYLLPLFLTSTLKTPVDVVGLIEGVAETTSSFAKLFSGYFSDKLRNRKWLAVTGYGLSTVAKVGLLLAAAWPLVFLARFFDRLGKGIRTAPRDALLADSTAESRRGAAFGFHRAGDTLGAFIGIALALIIVLLTQQQSQLLTQHTFDIVVLLSLIPAAAAVILLAAGLREIKPAQPATPPSLSLRNFDSRFKLFLLIVALFTLGNSADAFIVLLAQNRGASVPLTLAMVLTFNLVYALLAQPFGALSDRIGRRRVLIAGWLVYGLVYLGFALSQTLWQVWLLWAAYGLYYALSEGASKSIVADVVPEAQRGTAYGLYNATVGFVALPASLLAGLLWQRFGASVPFAFGALTAIAAAVLLASLKLTAESRIPA
jgi:MFS family permease